MAFLRQVTGDADVSRKVWGCLPLSVQNQNALVKSAFFCWFLHRNGKYSEEVN